MRETGRERRDRVSADQITASADNPVQRERRACTPSPKKAFGAILFVCYTNKIAWKAERSLGQSQGRRKRHARRPRPQGFARACGRVPHTPPQCARDAQRRPEQALAPARRGERAVQGAWP